MNVRVRGRRIHAGCAWIMFLPGTVLAAAADDIRGIREPKAVSGSWGVPALLAAVTIAACLAYVIRRWLHRSRRPQSLLETTLRRLEGARALMRPDTARAFGVAASELIRHYIEQRFDVAATRQTTEEFLHALPHWSNEALARHRALLTVFLQHCDLVKFAGDTLAVTDMESLFQSARGFVLETSELPVA
jgi:hypothetical protein